MIPAQHLLIDPLAKRSVSPILGRQKIAQRNALFLDYCLFLVRSWNAVIGG
jgi:hypothetical protein